MINTTWFIWVFVTIYNVVILLNFTIAYISETYEEVYGSGIMSDFENMAKLNLESRELTYGFYKMGQFCRHPFHSIKIIVLAVIQQVYLLFYFVIWVLTLRFIFDKGEEVCLLHDHSEQP